jgi:hypothetical protein
MRGKIRIVYWILAILFLFLTLAEAGFFTDVEGVVVGKKTFRIWGLPTGRRVVIKYQEPVETDPSRLVTRYHRIPVTYSIYKNFKRGERLEHYKLSFVFFRNDEPLGFSWDTRWTISILILVFFFFAAYQYGWPQLIRYSQSIRHGRPIRTGRYYQSS